MLVFSAFVLEIGFLLTGADTHTDNKKLNPKP